MTDEEFEFSELPERRGGQTYMNPERKKLADTCKSRPGEWLKVPESFYSHFSHSYYFPRLVKNGESPAFMPPGAFDARVRQGIVYIMYKGTP